MARTPTLLSLALASVAFAACVDDSPSPLAPPEAGPGASADAALNGVSGADFTSFDPTRLADPLGGCFNSTNGINCNLYAGKTYVYLTGGPTTAALENGTYFFAVLVPGAQNGGFLDGASGNLSDQTAYSGTNDDGSGDAMSARTFTISGGVITSYAGTAIGAYTGATDNHLKGTSTSQTGSKAIIQLMPYDDTENNGGVYILAICSVGATNPSQCKFDAFKVLGSPPTTTPGSIAGAKYYDANENGRFDTGETMLQGWTINLGGGATASATTNGSGLFSFTGLAADLYTVAEVASLNANWAQTGNTVNQTQHTPDNAFVQLVAFVYTIDVDGGNTTQVYFGNVCRLLPGGRTLGFWSNKNGQTIVDAGDIAALNALNLRDANGSHKDFTGSLAQAKSSLRSWLLDGNAVNMAYMLSVQLAATKLSVLNGFTDATVIVGRDGSGTWLTVAQMMDYANTLLGADGFTPDGDSDRIEQERVKNILDRIVNQLRFTQPTPVPACGTP